MTNDMIQNTDQSQSNPTRENTTTGTDSTDQNGLTMMNSARARDLPLQKALSLIDDGASLFGRMILLSEQQIQSLPDATVVVNLVTDSHDSLATIRAQGHSSNHQFYALPLAEPKEVREALSRQHIATHQLIGVTGTIGSGKSAAMKALAIQGALTLSADEFARNVVAPGSDGLDAIRTTFGDDYIQGDGTLDRKKLGKLIFSDPAQREALNAIVHPRIRQAFLEAVQTALHAQSDHVLIAYEVPLLFESKHSHPELEESILITASEETCIQRIMNRDQCSRGDAEQRIAAQMSVEEKKKRASTVISNDGSEQELADSLRPLFDTIHSLQKQ